MHQLSVTVAKMVKIPSVKEHADKKARGRRVGDIIPAHKTDHLSLDFYLGKIEYSGCMTGLTEHSNSQP